VTPRMAGFRFLEGITAQGFPLFVGRWAFLATWEKEPADPDVYHATFAININEQRIHSTAVEIDFKGNMRNRTIINVQGLVVPSPGNLILNIILDNGVEASYLIPVQAAPGAFQAQQAGGS
jgi:hypothetical protein